MMIINRWCMTVLSLGDGILVTQLGPFGCCIVCNMILGYIHIYLFIYYFIKKSFLFFSFLFFLGCGGLS